MSEQQPETKPEIDEEPGDCYAYCIECGAAIWEDCCHCNRCLRELNDHGESDENDWEY